MWGRFPPHSSSFPAITRPLSTSSETETLRLTPSSPATGTVVHGGMRTEGGVLRLGNGPKPPHVLRTSSGGRPVNTVSHDLHPQQQRELLSPSLSLCCPFVLLVALPLAHLCLFCGCVLSGNRARSSSRRGVGGEVAPPH